MDRDLKDAISMLRGEGYAVVIFTPDELDGAPPGIVESVMTLLGWDAISDLRPVRK